MFTRIAPVSALAVLFLTAGTSQAQLPFSRQGEYLFRDVPSYSAPVYYAPVTPVAPGVENYRAYYPTVAAPVTINVQIPANATIFFQGARTQQSGMNRWFESPVINPGFNYSYEVVATWRENDREVNHRRVIPVQPGDLLEIRFTRDAVTVNRLN
jgi:uncharacterized protein (TIGR03000 family)